MGMIKTLAWVIYKEEKSKNEEPGLKKDTISFEALTDKEVLVEHQLIPIPQYSKLSLYQWPILSVRYATAWSNWKAASGCWRSQVSKEEYPSPYGFGWQEGHECLKYAAENNWIPQDAPSIYDWEDIPQLAHDFFNGKINSYFPTFRVIPE